MAASPRSVLSALASLRLTVVLLILSIVLVFAATLDQVHLGVWGVQAKYFHSLLVFARVPGTAVAIPLFPGGYLLGPALLVNLIAAHCSRFLWSWKKAGMWLTHFGLILLLAGEGLSGLMQEDSQIRINVGETRRYAESVRDTELAVIDTSHSQFDQVVAIPASRLVAGTTLQHPLLPFVVRTAAYFPNAMLRARSQLSEPPAGLPVATAGAGTQLAAVPTAIATNPDEANWPAAYVELAGPEGTLGTFLVSTLVDAPESFTYQGRNWQLVLRPRRDYLPFALTLQRFTHTTYPGSDIPRDFASTLRLRSDDGHDDRTVRIFMNNPLRTAGRAFYQAGYANNDRTSVLQVVRNPSWRLPYVSCLMIFFGLVLQFSLRLLAFFRSRRAAAGAASAAGSPVLQSQAS